MIAEWSRIFLNVIFGLGYSLKNELWTPKLNFSTFLKSSIFSFRPKLTFSVTKFKIHPVEYVHMDHTNHFGFR